MDSAQPGEPPQQPIDVKRLIASLTPGQLKAAAEEYFAHITDFEPLLAKPFVEVAETKILLQRFVQLLHGLNPLPGMRVMDFAAGTCWLAHMLTQLGMAAVAVDLAPSALKIGRELYRRHPPFGSRPAPEFAPFDGERLPVADASIDRIFCCDAFHHVANPGQTLREMRRVLKPTGIAGFAEPGPEHSRSPQSQAEMQHHTVIESDVVVGELWQLARAAGFARMELAVFDPDSHRVGLETFESWVGGGSPPPGYVELLRERLRWHRVFFLHCGEVAPPDSRVRSGLGARLAVELAATKWRTGSPPRARARIENTGTARWLPVSAGAGGVALGIQLLDAAGRPLRELPRVPLTAGDRAIEPGGSVQLELAVPDPGPGRFQLEFDLVAEGVCWFVNNGTVPSRFAIEVT